MRSRQRRRLLRAALAGAGAALLGADPSRFGVRAQEAGPLRAAVLRDGLHQVTGAGGNIVMLGGASGLAMVDSGSPEHAQSIASLVAERFGGAPVDVLLNTHWHLEHTGGNEAVRHAATKIVAHENTRLWMSTQFFVDWQDRTYEPRPTAARPSETFYSSDPQPIAIDHDGIAIEYGLLREAHTDGDIYVRFPEHNVIVAGGALTVGEYPLLDYVTGGMLDGLLDGTGRLIDMCDGETLVIPAAGPAQVRRDLEAQRDMLAAVRERMQTLARQGKSVREMIDAGITKEFDARWGGNPEPFLVNAYKSLWGVGL